MYDCLRGIHFEWLCGRFGLRATEKALPCAIVIVIGDQIVQLSDDLCEAIYITLPLAGGSDAVAAGEGFCSL